MPALSTVTVLGDSVARTAGAVIVSVTAEDVEDANPLTPENAAVMLCVPAARVVVVKVAVPTEVPATALLPSTVLPSRNVTVPVGATIPEPGVTVAVKVMEELRFTLVFEERSVVLVVMGVAASRREAASAIRECPVVVGWMSSQNRYVSGFTAAFARELAVALTRPPVRGGPTIELKSANVSSA